MRMREASFVTAPWSLTATIYLPYYLYGQRSYVQTVPQLFSETSFARLSSIKVFSRVPIKGIHKPDEQSCSASITGVGSFFLA